MNEKNCIRFILDGVVQTIVFSDAGKVLPSTTVLNFLRGLPAHKGVKEGCAEGDCGACTIVMAEPLGEDRLSYKAYDSCLLFLPALHGKQLITVENLAVKNGGELTLHPVQQALVDLHGSQCGYCTPGIVMSMFALYKTYQHPDRSIAEDALTGNLCRCTGYQPILDAAMKACAGDGKDQFTNEEAEINKTLRSITQAQASVHIETSKQSYYRPATLREAKQLRKRRPEAIIINGATDVALRQTKKHEFLPVILDLSGVAELKGIEEKRSAYHIGSGVSMESLRAELGEKFPVMRDMLNIFASLQIRNVATLGGNIGSASPIGDLLPVLFSLEASVVLTSTAGNRSVLLQDFIKGYRKTDLAADELIRSIIIPKPVKGRIYWSHKVSKRKDLDISTVSAGFSIQWNKQKEVEKAILAYGGMAECTRRATLAEQALIGKKWERASVEAAMACVDECFSPISDARAGKDFRMIAAKNLLLKCYLDTL